MRKQLFYCAMCLTLLFGCSKSKIQEDHSKITEVESISDMTGIPKDFIIDKGEYYQVDKCIRIPKQNFTKTFKRQVIAHQDYPTSGVDVWYVPINIPKQNNIKVYLGSPLESPATDSSNWKQAIREAMEAYNSLIWLSNIHFTEVDNQLAADIVVKIYYSSTDNLAGSAELPAYGNPGKILNLNTYYNYYSLEEKRMVAVHEFGHNLGFLHTNGPQTGRFYDGSIPTYFNIWQVLGTPSSDTASVFNSDVASRRLSFLQTIDNFSAKGFSDGDYAAIQYLYNYTYGNHYIAGPINISDIGSYYYSFKPSILGGVSWNAWDLSVPGGNLINSALSCTSCDTTVVTLPVGIDSIRLVGTTAYNGHSRHLDIYRK